MDIYKKLRRYLLVCGTLESKALGYLVRDENGIERRIGQEAFVTNLLREAGIR